MAGENGSPTEASPLLGDRESSTDIAPEHDSPARDTEAAQPAVNQPDVPIPEEPSTAKIVVILGSIYVGVFLAALDTTIVATLAAPISTSFNSLSLLSWLASAYFIANAALQPLSGRLTDILSRRTGLIFSNVFFAGGNLICGLAKEEWVMILGRVVAGMGGGGLTAISTFVASDLIPLRKRGVVQGIGNICFGLGSGLGGVFGGWINDVWGWRYAFLIQLPFLVVSGILVFFTVDIPVKESSKSRIRRIDFLGALTLVLTLVLLLIGLNSGGNVVPWTHPLVLTTLPLSAVSLLLFIYVEDRIASEPVIPVRLLLNRTVASACLTNWFANMALFGLYFYAPIFFQLQGLSTTQAGARLIPQSIGGAVGSLGSGLIMKSTGRYWWLNFGTEGLFVLCLALVCTFSLTTPFWPPLLYFFIGGAGFGGMLTVTLLALISAVDHKHQAVITSASYAFRSTGSTIGITIASAVYQNSLKARLWDRFGNEKHAAEIIKKLRDSFDEIQNVPRNWKQGVLDSYMESLTAVFVTTLVMGIIGAVISLFMRENILHKTLARN